jgi:hypothetical protein
MAGDPKYLAWLRKQPCACQPCADSQCDANHSTVAPTYAPGERQPKQLGGRRGKGQKSADYYAFSLCRRHHGQFHDVRGYFEGWTSDDLERWQNEQSAAYRARYEAGEEFQPAHAPKPKSVINGFDVEAEIEALATHYQPAGGQLRFELKSFARRLRAAIEEGRTF